MKSDANAEIRCNDDGTLDEVCAPGGHVEQLDLGHWFVEVGDVAVWLHSSRPINASHERREPGKWEATEIERLEREVGEARDVATGLNSMNVDLQREVAELRAQNEAIHDDLHEHDEKRHWAEVKVAELRELLTDARLALRRVYNASGQPSGMRPLLDKFDAALNPPHAQGGSDA